MLTDDVVTRLRNHLGRIYGDSAAEAVLPKLLRVLENFAGPRPVAAVEPAATFDAADVVLIAYADQVRQSGRAPLEALGDFLDAHVGEVVNGLHLLPHYPSSSDEGFAVVDYDVVDPQLGDWSHVQRLAKRYRLTLDAVVNHTSSSHGWFRRWQGGHPDYRDFYITVDPQVDLSAVTRPRATALLTPAWVAPDEQRQVWTTFSADQVDLNYANPAVLLAVTEVLLRYVAHGARVLRLDAIAFLWKQPGTSCVHLPQTHEVVRLWRTIVAAVAPGTMLLTETNVPHAENVSYFGDGANEAHMVYQFPLAPLTLTAFRGGDASRLSRWAAGLEDPGPQATFFNFLGSHDGIGLRPAEGIVPEAEIAELCAAVEGQGGRVSYRARPDGSHSPYELNISYFDALNSAGEAEPRGRQVDRFLAAQSILLALAGVPGIYFHALFGSRNWAEGVDHTGHERTGNRQRLARATLEKDLADPESLRRAIYDGMVPRLKVRAAESAFHPKASQTVLDGGGDFFALQRTSTDGASTVVCVHEVAGRKGRFRAHTVHRRRGAALEDLIDGTSHQLADDGVVDVPMSPYGVRWLRLLP